MRYFLSFLLLLPWAVTAAEIDQHEYRLGEGDQIKILVFGEPDLSGELRIDAEGKLAVPLIGRIPATGKKLPELQRDLVAAFADGWLINPSVSIEVLSYRRVFVLGEVRNPGPYPYETGLTVRRAVGLAGGFTEFGDEDDVELNVGGRGPAVEVEMDRSVGPGDIIRAD